MNLTEAMSAMRSGATPENSKAFADLFRSMTEENQQVYITASKSGAGYTIDTAEHYGSVFCVMYSNSGEVQNRQGSAACTIGLSNLIDSVYRNPHIAGLVINPHREPVFMQRKDLQIISGKPDPRLQHHDWGKGIPEYNETDIMSAEEAFEFAMEIVAEKGLASGGYSLLETNSGLTTFPNFVAEKNGQRYFIAVGVAVAPKIPTPDRNAVPEMLKFAAENGNPKVYFAPVSFGSSDAERMEKGIVLIGDEFIGKFLGFIEIETTENGVV